MGEGRYFYLTTKITFGMGHPGPRRSLSDCICLVRCPAHLSHRVRLSLVIGNRHGLLACGPANHIPRFHTIYLPEILQALPAPPYPTRDTSSALGIPLSRTILAHAYFVPEKKPLGNVADPLEAIEKRGTDIVRFDLMRVGGRWKDDVGENSKCLKLAIQSRTLIVSRLVPFST